MAEKKKDAGRLDPNKSQIKGSKARTRRKLNLSTSLLHGREMRKVFGAFPGQTTKIQTPGQIFIGGKVFKFKDGVRFPEILPSKHQD